MATCTFAECPVENRELDESGWHVEVPKVGVMHEMCNTRYEASLCEKCRDSVDGSKGGDAVFHIDRYYHRLCLKDQWENQHLQLTLNFEEV